MSKTREMVSVPVVPSESLLIAFYNCPPEDLELAWAAMIAIAKHRHQVSQETVEIVPLYETPGFAFLLGAFAGFAGALALTYDLWIGA